MGRGRPELDPPADGMERVEMIGPERPVDEAEEVHVVLAGRRLDQAKIPEAGAGVERVGHAWREEENLHVGRGYQG